MISEQVIESIKQKANEQIEYLLSELGVDLSNISSSFDEIRMACPIHDGDNTTAFCYNVSKGLWACYSKHCEEGYWGPFGLIRLLLSKIEDKTISFIESVKWTASKLNIPLEESFINNENLELNKILKRSKIYKDLDNNEYINENFKPIPIDNIDITPSEYFLKQGFSKEILKKYNVGFCQEIGKPMYMRSFAPVLDDEGKVIIGVTGRTIYEECDLCSGFHKQGFGCPHENNKIKNVAKWKHFGFNSGNVLYNYWFAKDFIKKTKTIILTEGPKDVWWMEQNDIFNSVGIFGLKVNKYQIRKMISTGVLNVVTGLDKDKYGMIANEKLSDILGNYFKVVKMDHLLNDGEDIADMTKERMVKFRDFVNNINE